MLRLLVMLASIANCAGGLVLIATWATMWQHVPIIVLFIGGSLLILVSGRLRPAAQGRTSA